jgi:ElaB/YqjD/DUF883 family membrane-anchored ribosome-binding protein
MAHESMENMAGMTDAQTRKVTQAVQDVAERAGSYVQHQATQLADRAQELAHEANERVKEYTGRPLDAWVADIRDFVRAHPLQALAATIGLGYVLGKVVRR